MNPVIEAVEAGHIAHHTDDNQPGLCQKCGVPYPCPVILAARERHAFSKQHRKDT